MKPTTDGRWAHLACAIWIPGIVLYMGFTAIVVDFIIVKDLLIIFLFNASETCLSDISKMEPIDGLSRINKV